MDVAREWTHAQYWSTVFLSRFPELCTTYAGLFFMALGLGVLGKQKEKLWVVWLATTVIYILACGQYARIHQYVVLPFAPINAVFIGAGMVWAWERWGKARPQKILLSLLFLSIPVHAYFRIHHWFDLQETWVLRAAQAADQVSQPADLFYVNAADQPFFLYHLHRKGFAGSIHQLGLVYFVKARAMGARFLFSPTGGDWAKLQPIFDAQYKRVSTDPDFVIYDMGEKKPHG